MWEVLLLGGVGFAGTQNAGDFPKQGYAMKDSRSMRRPCYGFYMGYVEPYSGYAAFATGFPEP